MEWEEKKNETLVSILFKQIYTINDRLQGTPGHITHIYVYNNVYNVNWNKTHPSFTIC